VVRGAGFGHGVGMSAWGAYGFAKHGKGYRGILRHYYVGTRIGRTAGRTVRVLLQNTTGGVTFSRATRACGHDLSPGRAYSATRVRGAIRLSAASGRPVGRCGTRLRALGRRAGIRLHGVGVYRGALEVVPTGAGAINAINAVGLEDYVRGALPAEVPATWPLEALRAMAVAQRSIALSTDVHGDGFALYPDTRTQIYGGVGVEAPRTNRAVADTEGRVVTYRGRIAQATYFSSSGGRTESRFLGGPRVPYLKSVEDPYDYYAPQHRWTLRFTQAEMDARLGAHVKGTLRRIRVTKRGDTPRIVTARLVGSRGTTSVDGNVLRASLGLYERWAFFKRLR
jgi:stage II sporulation protein D